MKPRYIAFDCETYPFSPSLKAPPVVCLTYAERGCAPVILGADDAVAWFMDMVKDPAVCLIGHNTAFDISVMLAACPDATPYVFALYDSGRVYDTQIRQMLIDNAKGRFGEGAGYNLAELAKRHLHVDRSAGKKGIDVWRLRYNELAGTPVSDWPSDAVEYALNDAADTLGIWYAQALPFSVWANGRACVVVRDDGFVINEAEQVRAALALQLMSIWGLRVDNKAAVDLADALQARSNALAIKLKDIGFLREDGSEDTALVKDTVLQAMTCHATQAQRDLVAEKVALAIAAFDAEQAELVAKGERKKALKWSKTKNNAVIVSTWVRDNKVDLPLTETGQITTGVDVLEEIESPEIEMLVEFKGLNKRLSTYLETMVSAGDKPVCPGYNPFVRSGRCSSRKPNVQNFPRGGGERECFIPRNGNLFISADYSTLELRSWAQACIELGIDSDMARALREGKDLHSALAAVMLGWEYDYFVEALAGVHGPEKKATAKEFRSVAKPGNFGLPVGMGKAKFKQSARKSYGVNLSEEQADLAIASFRALWSEAPQYHNFVSSLLEPVRDEIVKLPDGTEIIKTIRLCSIQHPRSGRVRGKCFFTDASNSYFQGLAADGAKAALWAVCRACYAEPESPLFGLRPVAFIHDEVIIESPAHYASTAADALCAIMISEMEKWLPNVPVVCEPAIMDKWTKDAESIRLDNGNWSVYWYEVEQLKKRGQPESAQALSKQKYTDAGITI